jgi:hypothetical protein
MLSLMACCAGPIPVLQFLWCAGVLSLDGMLPWPHKSGNCTSCARGVVVLVKVPPLHSQVATYLWQGV